MTLREREQNSVPDELRQVRFIRLYLPGSRRAVAMISSKSSIVPTISRGPVLYAATSSSTVERACAVDQHVPDVRLTVTHENLPDEADREVAAGGWAAVMSNLKSLLETGHILPPAPWDMPHRANVR